MGERQDEAWREDEPKAGARPPEPAEQPLAQDDPGVAASPPSPLSAFLAADNLRRILQWALHGAREIAETLIPAVVIALIIHLFLAQATKVLGQSMEPTLHPQQMVVMEKATYRFFHGPRRGDIVVIDLHPEQASDDMLIKRVIGLPGETIAVHNGEVYIDGKRLEELWAVRPGGGDYGPTTIPPLHIFVMGDNRGASNDSRSFGPVHINQIVGRAWFSYWPLEHVGVVE